MAHLSKLQGTYEQVAIRELTGFLAQDPALEWANRGLGEKSKMALDDARERLMDEAYPAEQRLKRERLAREAHQREVDRLQAEKRKSELEAMQRAAAEEEARAAQAKFQKEEV